MEDASTQTVASGASVTLASGCHLMERAAQVSFSADCNHGSSHGQGLG